jgi:hypothetical protein
MVHQKTAFLWALLAVALLGLTACQSGPLVSDDGQLLPPREADALVAKPNSPIGDAPMPAGFVVVESKSRAHAAGGSRLIHHVYQGQGTRADVVNFYRTALSQYQWERKGESINPKAIDLEWTKGREVLVMKIVTHGGVTTIVIDIHNASDTAAAEPKPVP